MTATARAINFPMATSRVCSWRGSAQRRCGRSAVSWSSGGPSMSSCDKLGMEDRSGSARGDRSAAQESNGRGCLVRPCPADLCGRTSTRFRCQFTSWPTVPSFGGTYHAAGRARVVGQHNPARGSNFSTRSSRTLYRSTCTSLKAVKRSPLGLDLYLLAHIPDIRAQELRCSLSWKQLYRQFGADPSQLGKAGRHNSVTRFRADCLRELKKIKRAWPGPALSDGYGGHWCIVSPRRRASHRHSSGSSTNRVQRRIRPAGTASYRSLCPTNRKRTGRGERGQGAARSPRKAYRPRGAAGSTVGLLIRAAPGAARAFHAWIFHKTL